MHLDLTGRDPVHNADWLESMVLYSQALSFPVEALRSQSDVEGVIEEAEEPSIEPTYDQSERLVAAAIRQIERRAEILGEYYPFEIDRNRLKIKSTKYRWSPYTFCLLIADREFYTPSDMRLSVLFEHLAANALKNYIGGEAIRFGAPRDTLPAGIHDALLKFSLMVQFRKLKDGYKVNATDQDLGLDVAAWKSFSDGRSAKLSVFMQCATSIHWDSKISEPNLEFWYGILRWSIYPLRALAVPYVVDNDEEWQRAAGVLLMDRLRIVESLGGKRLPTGKLDWSKWCRNRIARGRKKYGGIY